jgi:hypothetical protein
MFLTKFQFILDKKRELLVWFFLLASYFTVGVFSILNTGFVVDEAPHLAAAHSYISGKGVNVEHPTLLKNLNAIIIKLFFNDFFSQDYGQWSRGVNFLTYSQSSIKLIIVSSRLVYLLFNSLIFAWIFLYTYYFKFLNAKFSLIFLTLLTFSPSFFSQSFLLAFDVATSQNVFIFTISWIYFLQNFSSFSVQKLLLNSFSPAIFLALAINSKFSSLILIFPIFLGFLGLVAQTFFNLFQKDKIAKFQSNFLQNLFKIFLVFSNLFYINLSFIWIINSFAYHSFFKKGSQVATFFAWIFSPLEYYLKGLNLTLTRSNDIHQNFVDGRFVAIKYSEFIFRVFWFKENPILILIFIYAFLAFSLLISLFKNFSSFFISPQIPKKFIFRATIFISFPVAYFLQSRNSYFTIGYRHFYPILIFIYAFLAFSLYQIYRLRNFFFAKSLTFILLLFYVIFGVLGMNSGISYVNFFWTKPKFFLTNDSTINWDQDLESAINFLVEKDLFSSSEIDPKLGKNWNLALACNNSPNKDIYLAKIVGKNQKIVNFSEIYIDPLNTDFRLLKQDYLLIDSNFLQIIFSQKDNNNLAKRNLEFLEQNQPIYQKNQIVWIYKIR